MRFHGTLFQLNYDIVGYKKKLDEVLQREMRNAAREWLRAVYPLVPVWTGTARGTLQPLGRLLRVKVPVSPEVVRPGRGPAVGAAQSAFEFIAEDGIYQFVFDTFVRHYIANEYTESSFNLRNPTPWHSLTAGENAFNDYLEARLDEKLPNVSEFLEIDTFQVK